MSTIQALQQFATPLLDRLALVITDLGSHEAYVVFLLVTYLAIDAKVGQRIAVVLLLGYVLNLQLKARFEVPRPFELEPTVARSEAAIATADQSSFPSGHAQASTTFWLLAAMYAKRVWVWPLSALLVALISLTRIYLGVHFPLDVLVGISVGVVVAVAGYGALRLFENLQGLPTWLVVLLGVLIPALLQWRTAVADSGAALGAVVAFMTGPLIIRHRTDVTLGARVGLVLVGLVLAFGFLLGSRALLPGVIRHHPWGEFLRYALLGYTATLVTPWLARRLRWVPPEKRL